MIQIDLSVRAQKKTPTSDMNVPYAKYRVNMSARLEEKSNPFVHLPGFTHPCYPVRAEGKIVSESGENTDKTYQIYQDSKSSQDCYTINVPIWNQDVRVLFEPNFFPGHFYFPVFKHVRVLLSIFFDRAEIIRFLDWGADVPLPMDPQGNHIVFGKHGYNETAIKYDYKSQKPLFNIKRVSDTDTELIQLEEGAIILQTKEEDKVAAASESYNLVPQVESTRIELAMKNDAAVGGLTADFEAAKTDCNSAISGAIGETEASLAAMEGEIKAKTNAIESRVNSAMGELNKSTSELEARSKASAAELQALVDL